MPVELKDGEGQAGGPADPAKEARCLFEDWKAWLGDGLDRVATFTKEKPVTGLALSFFAGILVSALLRRKS